MSQKLLPAGRALPDNGCTLFSGREQTLCPCLSNLPHESAHPLYLSTTASPPPPPPSTLNSNFPLLSERAAVTLIPEPPEQVWGHLYRAAPQGHLLCTKERRSIVCSACVPAACQQWGTTAFPQMGQDQGSPVPRSSEPPHGATAGSPALARQRYLCSNQPSLALTANPWWFPLLHAQRCRHIPVLRLANLGLCFTGSTLLSFLFKVPFQFLQLVFCSKEFSVL